MLHKTNIHSKLTICVLLMLFSMNTLFARTLHMIIVAQTTDQGQEIYSAKDYIKMQRLAEDISVNTGMDLQKHYFEKSSLNEDRLRAEINNIRCDSDDVLWFYYSGHGQDYNGKWPLFSLQGAAVGLNDIHGKLKAKNARLTITMYDCCNHGTGIDNTLGATRPDALATVYTTLFLKSKGDIMMCSSKKGQYSIGIAAGGVFTTSFISCLNRMQDAQNVSWDKLYEDVKAETQRTAQSLTQGQIDGNCNPDSNGKCQQCPESAIVVNTSQIDGGKENDNAPEDDKPTKKMTW